MRAAAAGVLAMAVVAGSLVLWVGLPVLGMWAAGELTANPEQFLLVVLLAIPTSMVAFGWLLYRVNAVYERLHGGPERSVGGRSAWLVASSDERASLRRARGPRPLIELAMTASAWAAVALLAIWFFFLADSPMAPLP
jgi:hypothetical protein